MNIVFDNAITFMLFIVFTANKKQQTHADKDAIFHSKSEALVGHIVDNFNAISGHSYTFFETLGIRKDMEFCNI